MTPSRNELKKINGIQFKLKKFFFVKIQKNSKVRILDTKLKWNNESKMEYIFNRKIDEDGM